MRFTSAGTKKVTVVEAVVAEPKFNKNDARAFDIALRVEEAATGEGDWWYGEISDRYGVGNASSKTQAQLTIETLEKLGLPKGEVAQFQKVIGAETEATIEASSCGKYFNVKYIGGGGSGPKVIDPAEAKRRFAAMFGGNGTVPAPAPIQAPSPVIDEPNPFF